jgi:hypothetical protein
VRGCSIFIDERRRNDFKCVQKLPQRRRFLHDNLHYFDRFDRRCFNRMQIYVFIRTGVGGWGGGSSALAAASLLPPASSPPPLLTPSPRTWKLLLNYLLCSRYRDVRDASSAHQSLRKKNTALTMRLTGPLVITLVSALMMRLDDRGIISDVLPSFFKNPGVNPEC